MEPDRWKKYMVRQVKKLKAWCKKYGEDKLFMHVNKLAKHYRKEWEEKDLKEVIKKLEVVRKKIGSSNSKGILKIIAECKERAEEILELLETSNNNNGGKNEL